MMDEDTRGRTPPGIRQSKREQIQAFGMDRDNQIGTGSTDLLLGAFHRGLLSGDNAWQYFSQIMWRQPFLYQAGFDPQAAFDGNPNPTVQQTYFPGLQIDAAAGIVYNNLYHVLGLDKITPLGQVIVSHRVHDTGTGADPYNSGFRPRDALAGHRVH